MMTTGAGEYREGTIRLLETPPSAHEGRVLVTFLEDDASSTAARPLQYGKYARGRMSTEDDFTIAEWRGEDGQRAG